MTATAAFVKTYTLEEYFELEYKSSEKHEYIDGKITEKSYIFKNKGRIASNLRMIFYNYLENSDLEVYAGDRMLYVPDCNKVYYPDLIVHH